MSTRESSMNLGVRNRNARLGISLLLYAFLCLAVSSLGGKLPVVDAAATSSYSPQSYPSFIIDSSTMRFKSFYQIETLSEEDRIFLQDYLIPTALKWISNRFLIRKPVSGKTVLQRECLESARWGYARVGDTVDASNSFDTCIRYDEGTCGLADVPQSHYGSQVYCSSESPLDCQTTEHGEGVEGADVLLYFTSQASGECSLLSSSFSHGKFCKQDQHGRPIAANVNFCPNKISSSMSDRSLSLNQLIKSILHALAFDYRLVPFFIDSSTGQHWFSPISENYWLGKKSVMLNTTRARDAARDHFHCAELPGAELENSNVYKLSYNMLLLEERVFHGEAMSPGGSLQPKKGLVFSNLTFSIAEDTGWYERSTAKTVKPASLLFGKDAGCRFATETCDTSPSAGVFQADPNTLHQNYCHEDNDIIRSSLADQTSIQGVTLSSCTYDMKDVGYCASPSDMDGCKIVVPGQISCSSGVDTADGASGIYHEMMKRGWTFGDSGACIPSTLHRRLYDNNSLMWQPHGSECHQIRCVSEVINGSMGDALYVKVGGLEGKEGWVKCPSNQVLDLQDYGFIAGTLGPCPDNVQVCSTRKCPNSCGGNGNCVDGQCECYDGFFGRDCTSTTCYKDTDCTSGRCDKSSGTCFAVPPPPPPPSPPPPPPPKALPPPPATPAGEIRGKTYIQGYLQGCLVFIDRNNNGLFDSASEPSSITDSTGLYIIKHDSNWSPIGDQIYVNEFDVHNVKVVVQGSEACVDVSTGLSLKHNLRANLTEGRVTPSTDLAYVLDPLLKATNQQSSNVLLQLAGVANANGPMLPDVVGLVSSKYVTRPAFLQLALESHIETSVSLAMTFLQSTSSQSTNLVHQVVLSSLANTIVGGSDMNSRRHLSSSQLSSFNFTDTNSILWFIRNSMNDVNNNELILSQAVANVIAQMNDKVETEANIFQTFGSDAQLHDWGKYLNMCTLFRVSNDYIKGLVTELTETFDLNSFEKKTATDEITKILAISTIPASQNGAFESVDVTNPSETIEDVDSASSSWLDGNLATVWISAGCALFAAGLFWAVLVFVVRRKKRRALRLLPELKARLAKQRQEAILESKKLEGKQGQQESSDSDMNLQKSALQLAFTTSTVPPMPSTVWRKGGDNKTYPDAAGIRNVKKGEGGEGKKPELWLEDL